MVLIMHFWLTKHHLKSWNSIENWPFYPFRYTLQKSKGWAALKIEIILNLVYGTETMTEKRIQKLWRLVSEIISINGKIESKICEKNY